MPVESFRGYVASIIAALLLVGGLGAAIFAWLNTTAVLPDGTIQDRDLEIVFLLIGSLTGGAATYLFVTDAQSRASHASERAFDSGALSGGRLPEQLPGTETTTTTTSTTPEATDTVQEPDGSSWTPTQTA